jgi:hypothetical protein
MRLFQKKTETSFSRGGRVASMRHTRDNPQHTQLGEVLDCTLDHQKYAPSQNLEIRRISESRVAMRLSTLTFAERYLANG